MFKTLQKLYNKSPKISFGLFVLVLVFNCSGTDEEKGAALVKDSIKAHGSMTAFNELKSVTFNKTTRLFEADGSIESEITQKQSFQLQPEFLTEIEWEKDSQSHKIFYDGVKAIKTINGEVITDSVEVLKSENAAKAASYVFFQPFKLQTDNTILVYEGDTQLDDSTSVSKVKVRYKDTNSTDKWTYYFDEDDVLVANSVVLTDHNSLILNLEYQKINGLLFNKYRKSYRVDNLLNKKYLRAEYFYRDLNFKK